MPKRYAVQKLKTATKTPPGTLMWAHKMDGTHAIWDGGITTGMRVGDIPWANIEKGGADKIATGLWSQYLKPVFAPEWWTQGMPRVMCSGELWKWGLRRQDIRSITARHTPDERWNQIDFNCFDLIPPISFFGTGGLIDLPHLQKQFPFPEWYTKAWQVDVRPDSTFYARNYMKRQLKDYPSFKPVNFVVDELDAPEPPYYDGLVAYGRNSLWQPYRQAGAWKFKKFNDDEGKIVAINPGLGKFEGMMGSLTLAYKGVNISVSGFTNEERQSGEFKIGDIITFKYRCLTKDGVPEEARYWRNRNDCM